MRNDPELYDAFADFIRDRVRDRINPKLGIRAFNALREPSVTHMCIPLENVAEGHSKLFTRIEEFKPNTILKTEEVVETGAPLFVAYVPFNVTKKKKNNHTTITQSSYVPQLCVVGYFICLIIAILKTEWRQWEYFLQ